MTYVKTETINGKDYAFNFGFKTLLLAEEEIGFSVLDAFNGHMSLKVISATFWAALQANHTMDRAAANDLIEAIGMERAVEIVSEGIPHAMGKAEPAKVEKPAKGKAEKKAA